MPLYLRVTPGAIGVRCFTVEQARLSCCLPSPPAGQGRPVAAIYTARLLGQGCASPARTPRARGQAVTAPRCLGSPSSARSRPATFGAPGGLSGGRHTVVTLCGTGATLGNPLRQLAALVKVQGPAQLFLAWWKRRNRIPAAEGGRPGQEARPQRKPSGGCLRQLVSSATCCLLFALAFCCGGFFTLNDRVQTQRAPLLVPNVAWDWVQQRSRVKPSARSLLGPLGRARRVLLLA